MKISKYLFLIGSLYLFSSIDAQQEPGEDLKFKVNKYYSSSFFNLLVKTKSCDVEKSYDLFYRKKGIEQALLKTIRKKGGIEIEAIISTHPKDDLYTQMFCDDDNKGEKNYVIQMQAICTAPDINKERCNEMFVDTDTKDFTKQLNNKLDNIQNAEDEKGFLENVKTASLERTDDSDFLDATRCNREQDVCFAGKVDKADKTCCGFPGCECEKTSLTFCQYLCKYNVADCSENCQTKYVDDKFGNFLCDNIYAGTTECLQPKRGVFLDGFITPVLEVGDLVLNGILNEEECKVELYKHSPTYEGFTYIIDANTNIKRCHFYRKEDLKTPWWLRFVASNVLNTDYMNAISFLDDSTNSPTSIPSVNHFCGFSLDNASQCNDNDVCPSGSDSDCALGQSCYGVEVCKNYFCGISLDDASLCNGNDVCPSGSDSDCALGQSCYGVEGCQSQQPTRTPNKVPTTDKSAVPSSLPRCKDSDQPIVGFKDDLKTCEWVSQQKETKIAKFCKIGKGAYLKCKETCNSCDVASCSDSDKVKFSVGHSSGKYRGCKWLRKHPAKIAEYCEVGKGAYLSCKETCNSCDATSCSDSDKVKFSVGHSSGKYRGCKWLRKHPAKIAEYCEVGKGAYLSCKETCESCD